MPAELPLNVPIGRARDPKTVAWLSAATLGVYGLVWFYHFGREVDAASGYGLDAKRWYRQMGLLALLVVTLPVALVHFFLYAHEVAKAVELLARRAHETTVDIEGRYPLLFVPFGGVAYLAMLQGAGNKIWARLAQRRRERDRAAEDAAEKRRPPTPVEQLIQCPVCSKVITVRYIPGQSTVARCTSCGFSAPFG